MLQRATGRHELPSSTTGRASRLRSSKQQPQLDDLVAARRRPAQVSLPGLSLASSPTAACARSGRCPRSRRWSRACARVLLLSCALAARASSQLEGRARAMPSPSGLCSQPAPSERRRHDGAHARPGRACEPVRLRCEGSPPGSGCSQVAAGGMARRRKLFVGRAPSGSAADRRRRPSERPCQHVPPQQGLPPASHLPLPARTVNPPLVHRRSRRPFAPAASRSPLASSRRQLLLLRGRTADRPSTAVRLGQARVWPALPPGGLSSRRARAARSERTAVVRATGRRRPWAVDRPPSSADAVDDPRMEPPAARSPARSTSCTPLAAAAHAPAGQARGPGPAAGRRAAQVERLVLVDRSASRPPPVAVVVDGALEHPHQHQVARVPA